MKPRIVKTIMNITTKIPTYVITLFLLLSGVRLSQKGTRNQRKIAIPNPAIPANSPVMNRIFAGNNFNTWNMNTKYHSGFIPAGAEANRSAFSPSSQGKNTAKIASMFITMSQINNSLKVKCCLKTCS